MQTPCPGSGFCPRSRRTAGTVQPSSCSRCSQSPLLPDCPPPAPALPESHECPRRLHARAAGLHTCSPRRAPSPAPATTPCDLEYGLKHRTRAGIARLVQASAGIRSYGGPGAGPHHGGGACSRAGSGRGRLPSGPLPPPGGGAVCARYCSSPCILGVPLHSFEEVALSSEPSCPRKEPDLTGGQPLSEGCQHQPPVTPENKVRFHQGSGSAVLGPGRRGGRSRREAWGGGFGEGGERGSSEELLPSLTATQRPTSFYYFYFLSGLLTFKTHDFCADRRLHPHQSAETFLEVPANPDFQPCCPASGLTPT